MTNVITVEFNTKNPRDIPHIGRRKKVRVNGRVETKYVKSVQVEVIKSYGYPLTYRGEYVLTTASGLWG